MKRMILAAATCLLAIPVAMATDDFIVNDIRNF